VKEAREEEERKENTKGVYDTGSSTSEPIQG